MEILEIPLFYFIPFGLFLFFIGLVIFAFELWIRRWLKAHRSSSAVLWQWLFIFIDVSGKILEAVGLFLVLMVISDTLVLRFGVNVQKQFLLTFFLVILPFLLAIFLVSALSHWLGKRILRNTKEAV